MFIDGKLQLNEAAGVFSDIIVRYTSGSEDTDQASQVIFKIQVTDDKKLAIYAIKQSKDPKFRTIEIDLSDIS